MENDVEDHQQKTDPSKESSSEPGFVSEQQQKQQMITLMTRKWSRWKNPRYCPLRRTI